MPLIKPFTGLRPAPGRESDVAAPPYDVMSAAEARQMVQGRAYSFLHISRPEVDLPEDTDPYAPAVYAKARENLDRMIAEGVLVRDAAPHYYVYRLTMGEHLQTGLVAAASVAAYDAERIKKHEFTRPVKEDDRVRQIDALNAQTGPVFLVYKSTAVIDDMLAAVSAGERRCGYQRRMTACATSSGWWTAARPSTGCPPHSSSLRASTWRTGTIAPPPPPAWPQPARRQTRITRARSPTTTSCP